MSSDDERGEEKELDLSSSEVVTKYKSAAEMRLCSWNCRNASPMSRATTIIDNVGIADIDMGCHIDGFIAVVAHTHVLHKGPVTGRAADFIAAANMAAEVALRLVRPGKKS
ncbi:ERBB-3 binding protein 1 [Tanacetum coccineum]